MAQSALATVADNAPAAGVSNSAQPHLKVQPALNGGFLTEFFKDIDGATRTGILVDRLLGLSVTERDKAIRDYKDANKIPSANKEGKTVTDPVASTRASEVKAIWAALNVVSVNPDELRATGYHKAVALSRRVLNDNEMDADGERKIPAAEKKEAKLRKTGAEAAAEVFLNMAPNEGESAADFTARRNQAMLDAQAAKTVETATADATKAATRLIEKYSPTQLQVIARALLDHLQSLSSAQPAPM